MNTTPENTTHRTNLKCQETMSPAEFFGWLEFVCWTMVVLATFLYWISGPAVSTDQFVVSTALVALALAGGIIIRESKWLRGLKKERDSNGEQG
jgi:hypothetical protein